MSRRKRPQKLSPRRRTARYLGRKALAALAVPLVLIALCLADRWFGTARTGSDDRRTYDGCSFTVTRVVDGDTLDVDAPDAQRAHTRIRLWGVDTPETVKPNTPPQHFGREAGDFTRRTCTGKLVRLELGPHRTRDRYGRLLAYVYLPDGRLLNSVLVEAGYGYADPRFGHSRLAEFHRLQSKARRARAGLWKDVTPADLPYYYRDKLKLPAPPPG